jgi:hypothetical protein
VHAQRKKSTTRYQSKGHAEQMGVWLDFLQGRSVHPFPHDQARQSMLLTFALLESIQNARSQELTVGGPCPKN